MTDIIYRFKINDKVTLKNSKKSGRVIAQESSYGLPTYQVKISENETLTLCERDLQ